ncbi:MAG: hypothetical protein HF973_05800 [Chloroflexi bacterium]|nr:hypothetical protein [Chloroflexota bacterium]
MTPYLLMAVLYFSLAGLMALDASLVNWQILPWFNGMRWLRIHFITLGILTQLLYGMLPLIVALRCRLPKPRIRWDIWATLNGGIMLLLIGIPLVNSVPIFAGGTLIFIATILLIIQLAQMKQTSNLPEGESAAHNGRKFYIAGLGYFLLGIILGTGMWIGWMEPLRVAVPVETHIHANNWGLMSLVFAGLLIDMYPQWFKRPFPTPKAINPIFWLMTLGAFGLIFGPWFAQTPLLVGGLVLHLTATLWLLYAVIKPVWGQWSDWSVGIAHLIGSYFWILAPVLVAPFVLLGVPGLPGRTIESTAPQALIYGWLLQFTFAALPYALMRLFQPGKTAELGGSWLSFWTINIGGIFLWASIFITPLSGALAGIAYMLWMIAMLPILAQSWRIVRGGLSHFEDESLAVANGD